MGELHVHTKCPGDCVAIVRVQFSGTCEAIEEYLPHMH
jgi:hypothetical protein